MDSVSLLFFCGVVKSILEIGAYSILQLGANHEQGSEVHEVFFIIQVLVSAVNSNAAMREQASPTPAIHVQ